MLTSHKVERPTQHTHKGAQAGDPKFHLITHGYCLTWSNAGFHTCSSHMRYSPSHAPPRYTRSAYLIALHATDNATAMAPQCSQSPPTISPRERDLQHNRAEKGVLPIIYNGLQGTRGKYITAINPSKFGHTLVSDAGTCSSCLKTHTSHLSKALSSVGTQAQPVGVL